MTDTRWLTVVINYTYRYDFYVVLPFFWFGFAAILFSLCQSELWTQSKTWPLELVFRQRKTNSKTEGGSLFDDYMIHDTMIPIN